MDAHLRELERAAKANPDALIPFALARVRAGVTRQPLPADQTPEKPTVWGLSGQGTVFLLLVPGSDLLLGEFVAFRHTFDRARDRKTAAMRTARALQERLSDAWVHVYEILDDPKTAWGRTTRTTFYEVAVLF